MCGIYGRISFERELVSKTESSQIDRSMIHRGPDGKGAYTNPFAHLGMRRLSIIDVKGGDQPIYNEDKSIAIVFNGEIYNYLELSRALKRKGHKFRTVSDTETIVHLYEEEGINCLKKLRGMFAFTLVDEKHKKIFIVRDRMGEKPLYWSSTPHGLVFASEMKSILKFKGIDKELNTSAFDEYFHFNYIPEPYTAFRNIQKLPAGCFLDIDIKAKTVEQKRYWDPSQIQITNNQDPTEQIRETFAQSCRLMLRSDVPVGISLSGGVDSSSILAFAAPAYKDTMKAFSIGYEGTPPSDERQMARTLANQFKVEFVEAELKTKDVVDSFPDLVWKGDDPIADIAAYSIFSVNHLSRENDVPVMLGGLGGDEMFWGYPWTQEAIKSAISPQNLSWRSTVKKGFESIFKIPHPKEHYLNFYNQNPHYLLAESFLKPLYEPDYRRRLVFDNNLKYMKFNPENKLSTAKHGMDLIRDLWLFSNCIALNDRLSMASSIELRSPFLDYKLVELSLSSKKVVEGYCMPQKYWLKKAMKGVLPDEVLNRPKRGFTPPVGDWLRGILKEYLELTRGGFLETEKIIDVNRMKLIRRTWNTLPMYWYQLYQLVLLELWGRMYYYDQTVDDLK